MIQWELPFGFILRCWPEAAPTWVKGGKWIPYTARQVMLRRAARLTCVVLQLGAVGPSAVPIAPPRHPILQPQPIGPTGSILPPEFFVPLPFGEETPIGEIQPFTTPEENVATATEPQTTPVLLGAIALLLLIKKRS